MKTKLQRGLTTLLAVLMAVSVLSTAGVVQAATIDVGGQTFQNGFGHRADLPSAKAALLQGVKSWSAGVDLERYGLGTEQVQEIYTEIFYENPSLFYLENGYSYVTRQSRYDPRVMVVAKVAPSYYAGYSQKDIETYEAAVQKALSVLRPGMTDLEKAIALHDYLVTICDYDDSLTRYSPYDTLVRGSSVCQGYLLAYSDLLNRAGIENVPAVSQKMNHGWNLVKLDGNWYHVDVTWDNTNGTPSDWVFHDNFLRTDSGIRTTGTGHSGWQAAYACWDGKYDNAFWKQVYTPFVFPAEGGCYFMKDGALCKGDLSKLTWEEVSRRGRGAWYGRVAYYDGNIYYTDARSVYRYDLYTGKTSLHATYNGGRGDIYGLTVDSRGLVADIRPSYLTYSVETVRFSLAAGHSSTCPARAFQDVSTGQWYHEAVDYVLARGLMNGTSATAFSPNEGTTRGMLVTILYRLAGSPAAERAAFADVAPGAWYADGVNWAAANGIVNGTSETTFAPHSGVTREQLAAILYRYVQYLGQTPAAPDTLSQYADGGQVSGYARDAMAWASGQGLITGRTPTTIAPAGSASRAETATILQRFCSRWQ